MLSEITWPDVGNNLVTLLGLIFPQVIAYFYMLAKIKEGAASSKAAAVVSGESLKELKANTKLTESIRDDVATATNGHATAVAAEAVRSAETARLAAAKVAEAAEKAAAVLTAGPAQEMGVAHIQLDDAMRSLAQPGERKEHYAGTISDKLSAVQAGLLAKVKELEKKIREKDERIAAMGGGNNKTAPEIQHSTGR